jgi:hypothetical protein
MSSPENFETTQKYASLAWEMIMDPAPMDNTQSSLPVSDERPRPCNKGCMIEAAVMMATVEEPCAVFKTTVRRKERITQDFLVRPSH